MLLHTLGLLSRNQGRDETSKRDESVERNRNERVRFAGKDKKAFAGGKTKK